MAKVIYGSKPEGPIAQPAGISDEVFNDPKEWAAFEANGNLLVYLLYDAGSRVFAIFNPNDRQWTTFNNTDEIKANMIFGHWQDEFVAEMKRRQGMH